MQDKPIINPLGQPFIELLSIDSTNNYALACIRNDAAEHGTAFFAHEQTAGKGQRGRKWIAEKGGNIALSILIKPTPLLVSRQFEISACLAVAVKQFFSLYAGMETKIKWPNDLYWQDRKAGGILIENIISGKQGSENESAIVNNISSDPISSSVWKWAVAGIGININQTQFPPDLPNPVSLKQITGKEYATVQLAKELCLFAEESFTRLLKEGFEPIYKEYNDSLYKINRQVKLKKDTRVFSTTIKGVSRAGQLITSNNKIEENFDFGEISWII